MSVAYAGQSNSTFFTSGSSFTFGFTPASRARGIAVGIAQYGDATDRISGVSYNGAGLSRVTAAFDTAGESGAAYAYFVGDGLPTDTAERVVTILYTGDSAVTMKAFCSAVSALQDTLVYASGVTYDDRANPQVTLDSGTSETLGFYVTYSGHDSTSALSLIAGQSPIRNDDFGAATAYWDRELNAATGSRAMGYVATIEDVAMVAIAIGENAAPSVVTYQRQSSQAPRIPAPPQGITDPNTYNYLQVVANQLNREAYISKFSGTDPNTSAITGIPGDLAVSIGAASDSTRLWAKSGATQLSSTTGWVRMGVSGDLGESTFSGDILFTPDNTYSIGTVGQYPRNISAASFVVATAFVVRSGATSGSTEVIGMSYSGAGGQNTVIVGRGDNNDNVVFFINGVEVARFNQSGQLVMASGSPILTAASASGGAGFRLPHGTAPSSPVNGDMWTTSAGLFVRINGVTKTVTLT